MEQSQSCEADSHAGSHEIPRLLCNPKVQYRAAGAWGWPLASLPPTSSWRAAQLG